MIEAVPYESVNFTSLEMQTGTQVVDIDFGYSELALNAMEHRIKGIIEPAEGSLVITSTHVVHDTLWNMHRRPYPAAIPKYLGLEILDIDADKLSVTLATRLYIPARPLAAELVLTYSPKEYTRHKKKYPGVTRRISGRGIIDNPYRSEPPETVQDPGVARPMGYISKIAGGPRSRSAD